MRTAWNSGRAKSSPSELKSPASAGTSTVRQPSSSARPTACTGPAPPYASSANSRGSRPFSDETERSARVMRAFAIAWMPAATSVVESPSGCGDALERLLGAARARP